ncbi:MAG: immunoglobulin domain-containing protein, partial [Limisphaerales bacterium]
MKTIAFLVLTASLIAQPFISHADGSGQALGALAISSQPTDQRADYGTDVVFTVAATGDGLNYKWQKDGTRLEDYKNIAGATTATLYIVGASQKDAGKYRVVISNYSGSITSSVATLRVNSSVVFSEDFESGSMSNNWKPLLEATNWIKFDAGQNHTDKGTLSAGGVEQSARVYHKLNKKIHGRVRLTFWMYDDGSSPVAYAEMRGYQGLSGYAKYAHPFAMAQSLAIGYRSAVVGDTNSGVMPGETINPTKYQGGVLRGIKKESKIGWFNLDERGAPSRSPGWHKFEIHRLADQAAIDFYVDGVRGRRIQGAKSADIDTIVFGLGGADETNQLAGAVSTAWFDDIQVDAYPEAIDYENDPSSGFFSKIMELRETGDGTAVANIAPVTVSEQAGAARHAA